MNGSRTARRLRLAMILVLMIGLALGSFWLFEVMRRATEDSVPQRVRQEPDFYVENFSYVKMAPNGKAQYHFSGARLTHNPQDGSYDIILPVVNKLDHAGPSMTIRSERGKVSSDNSQVHLYENVRLNRPASQANAAMNVISDYLLLLPDDDIVKTDKPVEITLGQSKLTGTGMVANNATRELHLTSNVHGTYQAAAR